MDKPDVSSLLGELAPTTEYAEFLKLWPDIKEARKRQVRLKAIYQKLTDNNLLSVSYVTFTRFVKKRAADENLSDSTSVARKKTEVADKPETETETKQDQHQAAQGVDNQTTSERIAAPAADALKQAKEVSSSKNYARNLRRGQ